MLPLPSCEALEVARAEGGPDLLVPMVHDAIRSVDVRGAPHRCGSLLPRRVSFFMLVP